jgi:NADPH:quinone reductase-like Zn-dependent oxidoreductase
MKAAIMVPGADGGRWDVREVQRPVVTPGHVLVHVHASSLNRAEFRRLHTVRVRPGETAPEARTGGGDAAGEVVEIGRDVSGIKPGDRVMGRCAGGFAEFALLDAREVIPAPERLSWEEAACIPIVFVVVHDALFVSGQLRAGETVLVTAAPGSGSQPSSWRNTSAPRLSALHVRRQSSNGSKLMGWMSPSSPAARALAKRSPR